MTVMNERANSLYLRNVSRSILDIKSSCSRTSLIPFEYLVFSSEMGMRGVEDFSKVQNSPGQSFAVVRFVDFHIFPILLSLLKEMMLMFRTVLLRQSMSLFLIVVESILSITCWTRINH